MTLTFFCAEVTEGKQCGYFLIGMFVFGKRQQAWSVDEVQSASRDDSHAAFFCRYMTPDNTGKSIPVGDGDGGVAMRGCLFYHFLRMRCTAEEGEVGGHLKFGVCIMVFH